MGRAPSSGGQVSKIPYRTPGEYRFADTPRGSAANIEIRRYIEERTTAWTQCTRCNPIEAQMKQQETVDKVFHHLKLYLIKYIHFISSMAPMQNTSV